MFCSAVLSFLSSFATILLKKRELVKNKKRKADEGYFLKVIMKIIAVFVHSTRTKSSKTARRTARVFEQYWVGIMSPSFALSGYSRSNNVRVI